MWVIKAKCYFVNERKLLLVTVVFKAQKPPNHLSLDL
ncbi:MAG: hypothetical protein ACJAXB_002706 [Candidatus Endobugula sp.]